jgi:hypothetical protein
MSQEFKSPVAIHTPRSNIDAQLITQALINSGINAATVEDISVVGQYALGTLDGIHKPQVFVDEVDVERAKRFIAEYQSVDRSTQIREYCYYCGFTFENRNGIDEVCPECGENLETKSDTEAEQMSASFIESKRRTFIGMKKGAAFVFLIPGLMLLFGVVVAAYEVFREIFGW